MDLRSLINTSDDGDRPPERPAVIVPKQQPYHQPPSAQTPTTPAANHGPSSYAFRESVYSHALQASPGKPSPGMGHEYSVHSQPPSQGPTYPPSPYQNPGPYQGRPAPPPLQPAPSAVAFNDDRSPVGAASAMPAPSPYRQTPTSAVGSVGGGYPFPPTGHPQEAASPVQRHQFAPSNPYPPRESFSHPAGPPVAGVTTPHSQPVHSTGPYMQQPQPQQQPPPPPHTMPQTPPVGTPGGTNPYLHQRSQSTHSTPTPTSAHSQHQYGPPPYVHGSPVTASHPPPTEYNRQASQPPTPLGPPMSAAPRHPSAAPSYAQPSSPYQQRMSILNSVSQPTSTHASPPPPPPPPLPRTHSNPHAAYDHIDAHRRSQSGHSERDRSISISPKSRVPSLPSSAGGHPHEAEGARMPQPNFANAARPEPATIITPAKRKLEDRDLSPRDLEKRGVRPPPGEVNGAHVPSRRPQTKSTASPMMQRKRRARYAGVPAWAETWNTRDTHRKLNAANLEIQKRGAPSVNGKHEPAAKQTPSRHVSPEASRASTAPSAPAPPEKKQEVLLGAWEPTITGMKPYEEISKSVADFLFLNVVNNPDAGEIFSRGVQFEIEAKLGTLIDKDTNCRVEKFVTTECILHDTGRIAFRSSMTEAQHKGLNEFLNQMVVQTDPRNPQARASRVQVLYKHRREVDKFYELPPQMHSRLPGCVRSLLPAKHTVKVRVTYDQKTRQVLQKIVKARVADLNLHMPNCPLDCRISVNLEMAWDGPVEEIERLATSHAEKFPDRNKDRLSYDSSHYQIDLTQVTQLIPGPSSTQRADKEHELEIELAPGILIDQGRRAMHDEPHMYSELVEGFVDNVRVLARRTRDFL